MSYNTPEGKIKRKVVQLFKQHGVWYFMPASNGFGKAGIPDFVACINGYFIGVETKADITKKPTKLQIKCGADIKQAGGIWMVVYDDDTLYELLQIILQAQGSN
jgi:Holliday junction resolvase